MSPSRKFLKELRALEKAVGREGIWEAAEEAERNLPKRGRKKGPIYQIGQAVERMRSLKAATRPPRSWRDIAKQVGKEFSIAHETLRTEERASRSTPTPSTTAVPEERQPSPPAKRRVITKRPADGLDFGKEDLARLNLYLGMNQAQEAAQGAMALMIAENQGKLDLAWAEMLKRGEQAAAEFEAHRQRIIQELVRYEDWRKLLGDPGKK